MIDAAEWRIPAERMKMREGLMSLSVSGGGPEELRRPLPGLYSFPRT